MNCDEHDHTSRATLLQFVHDLPYQRLRRSTEDPKHIGYGFIGPTYITFVVQTE